MRKVGELILHNNVRRRSSPACTPTGLCRVWPEDAGFVEQPKESHETLLWVEQPKESHEEFEDRTEAPQAHRQCARCTASC